MNVGPRWYVAHTYSGYENKVKASLEKIIENRGLGHLIFDISIPTEIVIEKNGDVEKEVENKIFSCYVYIKMIMNEESWHAVRNITGVTGFVGPGSRPTPLTDEEVAALDIEQVQQVNSPSRLATQLKSSAVCLKATAAWFKQSPRISKTLPCLLSAEAVICLLSSNRAKLRQRQTKRFRQRAALHVGGRKFLFYYILPQQTTFGGNLLWQRKF